MALIPEFILRKMFVKDSLKIGESGLSFSLKNTFAPATLYGFMLDINRKSVPPSRLSIKVVEWEERTAAEVTPQNPYPLPINTFVNVTVKDFKTKVSRITIHVITREVGELSLTLRPAKRDRKIKTGAFRRGFFGSGPIKGEAEIELDVRTGTVSPLIYGQSVQHMENCVYGGIWNTEGELLGDVVDLIRRLKPAYIKYPGGNFASGYHWEDGVGLRGERKRRFDPAWNAWESNRVGTDEFLALCEAVGASPFIAVNDGSGTPEEAGRWVSYCNEAATGGVGGMRVRNGHPEPYRVKLWGVGNEVWGSWQLGHTDAASYAERLKSFAGRMRQADPEIGIVASGHLAYTDSPADRGLQWNDTLLRQASGSFDYLSLHIFNPGSEGFRESYDERDLYEAISAAPVSNEKMVRLVARQLKTLAPEKRISLDEWNVQLPPAEGARSMHDLSYCLRDAIYTAGMLHLCMRNEEIALASPAMLVNTLPLIIARKEGCYATPIYYPYILFREMELNTVKSGITGPSFSSSRLGNIAGMKHVPYLDLVVTANDNGKTVTASLINRHPVRSARVTMRLGDPGFAAAKASRLSGPEPLSRNSLEHPHEVCAKPCDPPVMRGDMAIFSVPPASVTVAVFVKS